MQSVPLGAFGLMLLLLPLKLASPLLGLALLLFRELLSEPFGILLALGGFLFGLASSTVRPVSLTGCWMPRPGPGPVASRFARPGCARGNRPRCKR